MNVAWALFGRKPEHGTLYFSVTVAAGGDERYLLCSAGAAGVVSVPPLCSATSGCSCVRISMHFLNLWLQIALERRHDCCHALLLICA